MYAASQNGHKDVVECLAEHGADVNARNDVCSRPVVLLAVVHGWTCRCCHVCRRDVRYVYESASQRILVTHMGCMQSSYTSIYIAALCGHKNIVSWLAKHGADVNVPDEVCFRPCITSYLL